MRRSTSQARCSDISLRPRTGSSFRHNISRILSSTRQTKPARYLPRARSTSAIGRAVGRLMPWTSTTSSSIRICSLPSDLRCWLATRSASTSCWSMSTRTRTTRSMPSCGSCHSIRGRSVWWVTMHKAFTASVEPTSTTFSHSNSYTRVQGSLSWNGIIVRHRTS